MSLLQHTTLACAPDSHSTAPCRMADDSLRLLLEYHLWLQGPCVLYFRIPDLICFGCAIVVSRSMISILYMLLPIEWSKNWPCVCCWTHERYVSSPDAASISVYLGYFSSPSMLCLPLLAVQDLASNAPVLWASAHLVVVIFCFLTTWHGLYVQYMDMRHTQYQVGLYQLHPNMLAIPTSQAPVLPSLHLHLLHVLQCYRLKAHCLSSRCLI